METVTQNKHRAWSIQHGVKTPCPMPFALCSILFVLLPITLLLQGVGYAGEKRGVLKGKEIYHERCSVCHGIDGVPILPGAPNFSKGERMEKTDDELLQTVRHGKNMMPAWKEILTEDELKEVLMYSRVVAGDKVFAEKCLRCHGGPFPRLKGNLPDTKALKDFTGMLDVCKACEVEREMTREELIEIIRYLRTLGKGGIR